MNTEQMNKEYDYCLRCGRKLKNPKARKIGLGAVCERKSAHESEKKLFDLQRIPEASKKN